MSSKLQNINEIANILAIKIENIIRESRKSAYRAVNFTMVIAYWNIGKLIVKDELHRGRADYGKNILKNISKRLTKEFGKGFDERELRKMCQFYKCFQIWDSLRPELSWTHYRRLISVENQEAIAKYSVLNDAKQIFASKYKLTLPTEDELQNELNRARKRLELENGK